MPNHETPGVVSRDVAAQRPVALEIRTYFCPDGDVAATCEWRTSDVLIEAAGAAAGAPPVFRQDGVHFPAHFSRNAVEIVASKYFRGPDGFGGDPSRGGREHSLLQLVGRIAGTIAHWGNADGHLDDFEAAVAFAVELEWLMVHQHAAFNSPVQFNCGLWDSYGIAGNADAYRWTAEGVVKLAEGEAYKYPQNSACFIMSVEDNMEAIARRGVREMMLFKAGSGTGTDNSPLRSRREYLSSGGRPAGPVSYMEIYDAIAATTKSGGRARRAAKMETLKCHHPDILEFVEAKSREERKAHALIEQGYKADFNPGGAYAEVRFQNSNMSVRATDAFLRKATGADPDPTWQTIAVTTGTTVNTHGEPMPAYDARVLLDKVAEGTWLCGDPGMQFHDTIQHWHTSPNSGDINSSNPCSEFVYLDDTACNLASINLMKFRLANRRFDVAGFRKAVERLIVAQDILVDASSYPSPEIAANSHRFRPLGIGYSNLGALLMSLGLPYDSDEGRAFCGEITAIMTGQAYLTSARMAANPALGPFDGFAENREPMLRVMRQHRAALDAIELFADHGYLQREAYEIWGAVVAEGEAHGFRNSQVSLLAPCGTIAFMMDCDTTGIEPDVALVKYKKLAGGGTMKIVNQTVHQALVTLGYKDEPDNKLECLAEGGYIYASEVEEILHHVQTHGTIDDAPHVRPEHLAVFDCAFPSRPGGRSIAPAGHLKMMAAAQPFLSGAISKTVNVPCDATVADIRAAYVLAWELGLKAVAIYRDGSKRSQPLTTKKDDGGGASGAVVDATVAALTADLVASRSKVEALEGRLAGLAGPYRRKLPKTRPAVTHHFEIAGHSGYITVGLYPDTGEPGELFITVSKEGSTISGLMDSIGVLTSFLLQYGAPLDALVEKFAYTRFEPSGFTGNPDVPIAKSIIDYIFRWLGVHYVPGYNAGATPQDRSGSIGDDVGPPAHPASARPVARASALVVAVPVGVGPRASANGHAPGTNGTAKQATTSPARTQSDAPPCPTCGAITVRTGSCYCCMSCGTSLGCS